MNKITRIIIIILFCILICFSFNKFLKQGHTIKYKIKNDKTFNITETYTRNDSLKEKNYYIEIEVDELVFNLSFYDIYHDKQKIVEDVIYYSDNEYSCILPIVSGKSINDLICYHNYKYYSYSYLQGKDSKLDKFVSNIDKNIYDMDEWIDISNKTISEEILKLYTYNVIDNIYVGTTNLKGLYVANKDIENVKIFSKDQYSAPLSTFVDKYYIVADYNLSYEFRKFYIIDITNNKIKEIQAPQYISFTSYIEGVVDNKVYIYDIDNEKQYIIDIDTMSISSNDKIEYYSKGEWTTISPIKASKYIYFDYSLDKKEFIKYDYVYKTGTDSTGYYYLYKKNGNTYDIYRCNIQNTSIIKYLFTTSDIESIVLNQEYAYYKDNNKIKYYSDLTGIKTIVEYSELEFNDNLIYGVYIKRY